MNDLSRLARERTRARRAERDELNVERRSAPDSVNRESDLRADDSNREALEEIEVDLKDGRSIRAARASLYRIERRRPEIRRRDTLGEMRVDDERRRQSAVSIERADRLDEIHKETVIAISPDAELEAGQSRELLESGERRVDVESKGVDLKRRRRDDAFLKEARREIGIGRERDIDELLEREREERE